MTTPPQPVYTLKGLGAACPPERPAFRDLWLSLPAGARLAVVGPAGAGKTTLLRIMAGELPAFEGEAQPAAGITVGHLPPEPRINGAETVAGAIEAGVSHLRKLLKDYDAVMAELASGPIDYGPPMEAQGRLEQALNAAGAWRLDRRVESLTAALRLPPGPTPLAALTAAERRRLALCRLLLQAPDLLLLDDPAADLDAEAAAWLDRHLAAYRGTVVAATRDRCFLEGVADWILELDGGAGAAWRGGYASWLEQKREQLDGAAPACRPATAGVRTANAPPCSARSSGCGCRRACGRPTPGRAPMQEPARDIDGLRAQAPVAAVVEAENLSGSRAAERGRSSAADSSAAARAARPHRSRCRRAPSPACIAVPGRCGKTTLLRLIAGEHGVMVSGGRRRHPARRPRCPRGARAWTTARTAAPHPDPRTRPPGLGAHVQGDGKASTSSCSTSPIVAASTSTAQGCAALEEALLARVRCPAPSM